MLTSLSQQIRRMVNAALGRAASRDLAAAAKRAAIAPASVPATLPALRLVRSGDAAASDRDIPIRVAAGSSIGASAFVAGRGARLYSLDVFRSARRGHNPGSPAAPSSPRAA